METKIKLSLGSVMTILRAFGLLFGPTLGVTALGRPWSFFTGFVVGVVGGIGTALVIAGLIEKRQKK